MVSMVLKIVLIVCVSCGFLLGCNAEKSGYKMATVKQLREGNQKFQNGNRLQVEGFATPYPMDNFYYFSSTKERKKGPWILIYSEKVPPISKHVFIQGRWNVTEDGSSLNVHGWFFPF